MQTVAEELHALRLAETAWQSATQSRSPAAAAKAWREMELERARLVGRVMELERTIRGLAK